jgi:hypothetical protein
VLGVDIDENNKELTNLALDDTTSRLSQLLDGTCPRGRFPRRQTAAARLIGDAAIASAGDRPGS